MPERKIGTGESPFTVTIDGDIGSGTDVFIIQDDTGVLFAVDGAGNITALGSVPVTGSLDDLSDVDLTVAPTDGQVLQYENSSSSWKAATPSGGGGGTLVTQVSNSGQAVTSFTVSGLDSDNDEMYEIFYRIRGTQDSLIMLRYDTVAVTYTGGITTFTSSAVTSTNQNPATPTHWMVGKMATNNTTPVEGSGRILLTCVQGKDRSMLSECVNHESPRERNQSWGTNADTTSFTSITFFAEQGTFSEWEVAVYRRQG